MKIAIILNGISLQKKLFFRHYLPALKKLGEIALFETHSAHDAVGIAQKAVYKKFDLLLAAGGDGTLHQVINGILREESAVDQLPAIGLIPIGSGNDFARTLNLPTSRTACLKLISQNTSSLLDIGTITFLNSDKPVCYFINQADIGMGPDVVRRVLTSGRPCGSGVAYYLAILKTFITYTPFAVKAIAKEWTWEGKIRTLAIANGKYYGNGLGIAPDAVPDDGIFSAFICSDVSVFDFIRLSGTLKKCKKVTLPKVQYRTTQSIELHSPAQDAIIEADGEVVGKLPVRIDILPKRIRFLMAPLSPRPN